ncbi:AAA family ATPase [Aquimarina litoralis]|uniref:AAA family ATPase n=1 Tax=Aquimarina litoralis TaxID=584605 RepID=A0ABP3TN98_9FLAO
MNISVEYHDLSDDEIPEELYRPRYRINDKLFIDKDDITNSIKILPNVSKVNFFIGANNSGKSRFLRGLFKLRPININLTKNDNLCLIDEISNINYLIGDLEKKIQFDVEEFEIIKNLKSLKLSEPFNCILNYKNKTSIIEDIKSWKDNLSEVNIKKYTNLVSAVESVLYLDPKIRYSVENKPFKKTYIPILRCPNSYPGITNKNFLEALENSYGISGNVFNGLELYSEIKDLQESRLNKKNNKKKFESFLSKCFFNNQSVEITAYRDNRTLLYSVGEEEHELFNIGDGIQSLILILFPIFMAEENEWLFIEEPETHLHPGYQRIFLDTILNNEYIQRKNLRLFFSTHSNHFLDQSLANDDISIFQFKKENKGIIDVKTNIKPSKEALDLLGVTSSSVLIANSSIWVEGPTDRKYISKWLKTYKESSLKEDIDYAFFEYGGNLIAHYLFDENFESPEEVREQINSFALSNHIYLLADNDNPQVDSAKAKRRFELEKLSEQIENFLYQNTEVKEIENLLPVKILKDFLPNLIKNKDKHLKSLESISFKMNDYQGIGLGSFLYDLLKNNGISEADIKPFDVKSDSGTIKPEYKRKLCDFVINNDEYKYEVFIEENDILKKLIENLYNFIKPKT